MKCPYCLSSLSGTPRYCPNCSQPLSRADSSFRREQGHAKATAKKRRIHVPIKQILLVLFILCCIVIAAVGLYKLYFWMANYRINRLYTRGEYTPTINSVTLEDSRPGHSIVFYGEDGDTVFIPELDRTLSICGGVARVIVADSEWFSEDVSGLESAEVTLNPVLISETGIRTYLPSMIFTVDVPSSPLKVISPSKNGKSILTSRYDLELQLVAGSTVYINGEDVSSRVTKGGELKQTVLVQPIGTNTYSVIVRTKNHRETRQDIEIYRTQYPITVELDDSIANKCSNEAMAITGTTEPGCTIEVETPCIEESIQMDTETGRFAFIAKFSGYGDNVVRFRIRKPGKQDDILSMTVDYSPSLAAYSAKAWAMDYNQLTTMFEQWHGKVFLCKGKVVATFTDDDKSYMVMDVSGSNSGQYIILENHSSIKSVTTGTRYSAYADVTGRMMYNAQYYPALCARYIETMA